MPALTKERSTAPIAAPVLIGRARPNIIVADIGGTWTRIARGDERIHPENIIKYRTPQNYDQMVMALGNKAVTLTDGRKIDAFGFGIAGQVTDGVITKAGMLTEYGCVGKPIVADAANVMGTTEGNTTGSNDVRAAGKGEQVYRRRRDGDEMGITAMYTIATGFAGAIVTKEGIDPDEAGHHYLKSGAWCGCGQEGCMEAHISGSGIQMKFGIRGENVPEDSVIWDEVRRDTCDALSLTLTRYRMEKGIVPDSLVFYGAVALNAPGLLSSIEHGMALHSFGTDSPPPSVETAHYGDDSGLYGSYFDALETL